MILSRLEDGEQPRVHPVLVGRAHAAVDLHPKALGPALRDRGSRREELGIDPKDLGGSATEAAVASFVLFAIGAVVPILPFLLVHGGIAVMSSVAIGALALFGIGAVITLFTGTPVWRSGGRQLLLGLAAAGVTFGVGKLIGIALAG